MCDPRLDPGLEKHSFEAIMISDEIWIWTMSWMIVLLSVLILIIVLWLYKGMPLFYKGYTIVFWYKEMQCLQSTSRWFPNNPISVCLSFSLSFSPSISLDNDIMEDATIIVNLSEGYMAVPCLFLKFFCNFEIISA